MSTTCTPTNDSSIDLEAGATTTTESFTNPIVHGVQFSWNMDDDNEVYDEIRSLWRSLVGQAGGVARLPFDPNWMPSSNDYVLEFKSSGYKGGRTNSNGNWKQFYKYHITLRRKIPQEDGTFIYKKPATSLDIRVIPQKQDMTYKDGGSVDLPHGVGSQVKVQTTFSNDPSEITKRGFKGVRRVLSESNNENLMQVRDIKDKSHKILKAEVFLRFNIERKQAMKTCLDKSEDLMDIGGSADMYIQKDRHEDGWAESRVVGDKWNWLGFDPMTRTIHHDDGETSETVVEEEIKMYQMNGWQRYTPGDWQHHPKLETSIGKGNPHVSQWDDVIHKLKEKLLSHAKWAGIREDDLVADPFFKPAMRAEYEWEHPEGRREDLKVYFNRREAELITECMKPHNMAVYDIVSVILERYGATYKTLVEETGYNRSNIDYHVRNLCNRGLLETSGNPAVIALPNDYLWDGIKERFKNEVGPYHGETTLADRRLSRHERAEEQREKRENGEANGTGPSDDNEASGDANTGDDDTDANDGRTPFVYLENWDGTPQMMINELVDDDHPRGERDVRVREFGD